MSTLKIHTLSVEARGARVVDNATLSVSSGEAVFLLGPNGSGKSSFAGAVFGHPQYAVAGGSVQWDGEDVTALPADEKAKRGLFLSLQHVPEVHGVGLWHFLHRAHHALTGETVSVLDFKKKLSERLGGLGLPVELLARELNVGLSGGEKKLAELMQLVALGPKMAVLDEIDSGVDVDSLKLIARCIEALRKEGTGFLIVTHRLELLSALPPSRVYVMKEGAIVGEGGAELAEKIADEGFK